MGNIENPSSQRPDLTVECTLREDVTPLNLSRDNLIPAIRNGERGCSPTVSPPRYSGPHSGCDSPPLVTNTEKNTPPDEINGLYVPSLEAFRNYSPRAKRYHFQSLIKEILGACEYREGRSKYYRFGACKQLSTSLNPNIWKGQDKIEHLQRWGDEIQEKVSNVAIMTRKKDAGVEAHYSGLCSCNSVWICPVCGPVVAEYRAKEISQAMYLHQKAGGWLVFMTFTIRHRKSHTIKESLTCLRKSLASTKYVNKVWTSFRNRIGLIGTIRAVEYTYTEDNGHHPHVHELWFLDKEPDPKMIKRWMYDRYSKFVVKHEGFEAPSYKYGVDVRVCLSSEQRSKYVDTNNELALSHYLSKGANVDSTLKEALKTGWGVPQELTKNQLKKPKAVWEGGSIESYNSTTLALEYMKYQHILSQHNSLLEPDRRKLLLKQLYRFKQLYNDYAEAFFGKSQLHWSKGLKDKFLIHDMDDKQVNEAFEGELEQLMVLDMDRLQKVIKLRLRSKLLDIVESPLHKTDSQRIDAVKMFIDNAFRVNRYG